MVILLLKASGSILKCGFSSDLGFSLSRSHSLTQFCSPLWRLIAFSPAHISFCSISLIFEMAITSKKSFFHVERDFHATSSSEVSRLVCQNDFLSLGAVSSVTDKRVVLPGCTWSTRLSSEVFYTSAQTSRMCLMFIFFSNQRFHDFAN